GMKATEAGMVVGQAMSSFDGIGQGVVTVFIKNIYYGGLRPVATINSISSQPIADLSSDINSTIDSQSLQATTDPTSDTSNSDLDITNPKTSGDNANSETLNTNPTVDVKDPPNQNISSINI